MFMYQRIAGAAAVAVLALSGSSAGVANDMVLPGSFCQRGLSGEEGKVGASGIYDHASGSSSGVACPIIRERPQSSITNVWLRVFNLGSVPCPVCDLRSLAGSGEFVDSMQPDPLCGPGNALTSLHFDMVGFEQSPNGTFGLFCRSLDSGDRIHSYRWQED